MIKKFLNISLLIIFVIGAVAINCSDYNKNDSLATVDGIPVSKNLFALQVVKARPTVYEYYYKNFGVKNEKDFWNRDFGNGNIPAKMLKKNALDSCTRILVQQKFAREKGIKTNIVSEDFLKSLTEMNVERNESLSNKKVVYGSSEYGLNNLFEHQLAVLVEQLKEKMAKEDFNITNEALQKFYERNINLYRSKSPLNKDEIIPFDEIKSLVRIDFIDALYDSTMDDNLKKVQVVINHSLFDSYSVN